MVLKAFATTGALPEQPFHLTDDLRGTRLNERAVAYDGYYRANDRNAALSSPMEFLKAQAYPDWRTKVPGTGGGDPSHPLPDAEDGQARFPAGSARSMETPMRLSVGTWTATVAASVAGTATAPLYWRFFTSFAGNGYALRLDGRDATTLEAVLGRVTDGSFSPWSGTATVVGTPTAAHQFAIDRRADGQLTLRVDGTQTAQRIDGQFSRPQATTFLSTGGAARDWLLSSVDVR